MITRNYPHITAPAGIKELHSGMVKADMDEITAIPFYFIRGVRTDCDMIRGEETEIVGINNGQRKVYILPGTHSKIMRTDEYGRITNIKTMLTGEMAAVLSRFWVFYIKIFLFFQKKCRKSLKGMIYFKYQRRKL